MESSPLSPFSHSTSHSSDCLNLGRSSSPSFPYYHNWKLDFGDSLTPKVCFFASFVWFELWVVIVFCCCDFEAKGFASLWGLDLFSLF
jgi:hypothetical protein